MNPLKVRNRLEYVCSYIKYRAPKSPITNDCRLEGSYIIWLDKQNHIRLGRVVKYSKQNSRVAIVNSNRLLCTDSKTPYFSNTLESVHVKRMLRIN